MQHRCDCTGQRRGLKAGVHAHFGETRDLSTLLRVPFIQYHTIHEPWPHTRHHHVCNDITLLKVTLAPGLCVLGRASVFDNKVREKVKGLGTKSQTHAASNTNYCMHAKSPSTRVPSCLEISCFEHALTASVGGSRPVIEISYASNARCGQAGCAVYRVAVGIDV